MQENQQRLTLQIDGDLQEMIPLFLEKRAQDLVDIESALEGGDFAQIGRIGHNLKGIGAGYGFARISEIGLLLEQAAKQEERAEVIRSLDELRCYLERIDIVFV